MFPNQQKTNCKSGGKIRAHTFLLLNFSLKILGVAYEKVCSLGLQESENRTLLKIQTELLVYNFRSEGETYYSGAKLLAEASEGGEVACSPESTEGAQVVYSSSKSRWQKLCRHFLSLPQ